MKKFGEKFERYEPIEIEPESVQNMEREFQKKEEKEYEEIGNQYKSLGEKGYKELRAELKAELNKPVIEVAPTANVHQISLDQEDVSDYIKKTFTWFNYYVVELGLNVMVGRKLKVPELLFKAALTCDKNETDVVAYDIAPKDETKYTKLLSGNVKITLGVTTLLRFIPVPLGEVIPDLLKVDINPWEFEWGMSEYMIDAAGEKSNNVYWKIYRTDMVQGFNPTIIVRAKKDVSTISAGVRCVYLLKAGWRDFSPRIESREKEVIIWPV